MHYMRALSILAVLLSNAAVGMASESQASADLPTRDLSGRIRISLQVVSAAPFASLADVRVNVVVSNDGDRQIALRGGTATDDVWLEIRDGSDSPVKYGPSKACGFFGDYRPVLVMPHQSYTLDYPPSETGYSLFCWGLDSSTPGRYVIIAHYGSPVEELDEKRQIYAHFVPRTGILSKPISVEVEEP